ncbi:inositol monophosphatase family protein [Liquorilactobacillus sicerae]|uniref:inositol monophosphatase family protein n=1 Tax=Liquorilactobacillus sicerae TaxID=1416943 RepID=UPI00247FBECB|nr:inositol monophosphatase family protein [Liquorilactobacillus sicerae]
MIFQADKIDLLVPKWLMTARKMILESFSQKIEIETKTSRNDLVTELDRKIEQFLVGKIQKYFPGSQIVSEETRPSINEIEEESLLWVIDPIDGTMNFVKQKSDFAIMIGIFQAKKGQRGFIYDVMANQLYHGGPDKGVYCNCQKMISPPDLHLADGLLGVGGVMLINNKYNLQKIALASHGIRIYGSAGIEIIHVLNGQLIGYLSHLHSWDLAAGKILAETLGLTVKTIDGQEVNVLSSIDVLVASKNAQKDIIMMAQSHC